MGSDIVSDIASGRSTFKKSFRKRGIQSLGNVTRKVMKGDGRRGRRSGGLKKHRRRRRIKGMRKSKRHRPIKVRGAGMRHMLLNQRKTAMTRRSRGLKLKKKKKKKSSGKTVLIRTKSIRKGALMKKRKFKKIIPTKKGNCTKKRNLPCHTSDIFSL